MATRDQHFVDTLVRSHTPLVSYAVRAVAPRLPDPSNLGDLVAAGLVALRGAADTHAASGQADAGFAAFAKPRITTAIAAAVAARATAATATAPPLAPVADLLSHMESIDGDSGLLAAAHPAAFAVPSPAPRHQVGHYAAVAAASDFRSHLDSQATQHPNAAQLHAFGT